MPKLKTHKGCSKRFKLSGSGKVLRKKAYHSHLLTKKRRKKKRALKETIAVDPTDMKKLKLILPYA